MKTTHVNLGRVLLITGPAASGKTTLARAISHIPGWTQISEDEYWVRHGWHGHRTEEQEAVVQQEVINDMMKLTSSGRNVVLEFILYKQPPNPLTEYVEWLQKLSIDFDVVALKPDVPTLIQRMVKRGRPDDLEDLENRKEYAVSQVTCLNASWVDPSWIMDTSGLSAEEVLEQVEKHIL